MKMMGLLLVGLLGAVCCFGKPAFVDLNNGIVFPAKLNGLTFDSVHEYDDPALGYSLRYAAGSWHKIDIYVYNLGHKEIPDGTSSEAVKKEARSVSKIVSIMEEKDTYEDVRKLGKTTTPLSGPIRFIKESYQYTENNSKQLSESYITGYRNHFFKIRFSYLAENRARAKKVADATVKGLIDVMKYQPKKKQQVLYAVEAFAADPTSDAGRSLGKQLIQYANVTEGFTVSLPAGIFSWMPEDGEIKNSELLFIGYIAGALEHIHTNGLSRGGEVEGFSFMLETYETLRKHHDIVKIPELETWLKSSDRDALLKSFSEIAPE